MPRRRRARFLSDQSLRLLDDNAAVESALRLLCRRWPLVGREAGPTAVVDLGAADLGP